jgi:hypothetical protein
MKLEKYLKKNDKNHYNIFYAMMYRNNQELDIVKLLSIIM